MKKSTLLLLGCALFVLLPGCASRLDGARESREYAVLGDADRDAIVGHLAAALATEFAPGKTVFCVSWRGPERALLRQLEHALRTQGFGVAY